MDKDKTNADTKKPAKNESALSPHAAGGAGAPSFPLERLAKDCHEIFGVTPSTFAGATCGLEKDCKMTVADMKAHIKKWLDTPINLGGRKVE